MYWFLYDGVLHHERVKEFLSLKLQIVFSFFIKSIFVLCVLGFYYWFQNGTFYEMAICYIMVLRSYNNTVLYKINTFIKKQYLMVQLEIDWRRKLKPLIDPAFHIFFQKTPLISYVWILFSHIYSIFCGLDLIQVCVDTCRTRVRLVLIRVDLSRTRVDSCQTRVDSC